MCGRFTLKTPYRDIARKFLVELSRELRDGIQPRYNIAPSQGVLAVWDDWDAKRRKADFLHWGLVPRWADDVRIGYKLINARSETAAGKPSFRHALRYRRCLLPCDGFFEWKRECDRKEPHYFQVDGGALFALAGIWEIWQSPDGSEILSCSLLTTGPNAVMAPIHDRMPVIIEEADYDRWLDPAMQDAAGVQDLLRSFPAERMGSHRVTSAVNSARHDDPELVVPLDSPAGDGSGPTVLDFFDTLFPNDH